MNDRRAYSIVFSMAALVVFIAAWAAVSFYSGERVSLPEDLCNFGRTKGTLVLEDVRSGEIIAAYPMKTGDEFSIGFIHSVNKSPVTDYYALRSDGIYVVKTVYYGFGAGVQTELEEGQKLTYGDDGSMIITGFDRKMDDLIYFVGTVSDHTLTLLENETFCLHEFPKEKERISLRDLCGRNAMVRFSWYPAGGQRGTEDESKQESYTG